MVLTSHMLPACIFRVRTGAACSSLVLPNALNLTNKPKQKKEFLLWILQVMA